MDVHTNAEDIIYYNKLGKLPNLLNFLQDACVSIFTLRACQIIS